jgi:hypothetical protein
MAAAARAAHLIVDDDPPIFADTLAVAMLGERADELIGFHRAHGSHPVLSGARAQVTCRSRYTEDSLARAVASGVSQYVMLGAGLDSFACRSRWPARYASSRSTIRPPRNGNARSRPPPTGLPSSRWISPRTPSASAWPGPGCAPPRRRTGRVVDDQEDPADRVTRLMPRHDNADPHEQQNEHDLRDADVSQLMGHVREWQPSRGQHQHEGTEDQRSRRRCQPEPAARVVRYRAVWCHRGLAAVSTRCMGRTLRRDSSENVTEG